MDLGCSTGCHWVLISWFLDVFLPVIGWYEESRYVESLRWISGGTPSARQGGLTLERVPL